jgi:hypothetical protein
MDDNALQEAKRRVSRRLLGQHGIHGVSADEHSRAVLLWREVSGDTLPTEVHQQAETLASPFRVELRERPMASPLAIYEP